MLCDGRQQKRVYQSRTVGSDGEKNGWWEHSDTATLIQSCRDTKKQMINLSSFINTSESFHITLSHLTHCSHANIDHCTFSASILHLRQRLVEVLLCLSSDSLKWFRLLRSEMTKNSASFQKSEKKRKVVMFFPYLVSAFLKKKKHNLFLFSTLSLE